MAVPYTKRMLVQRIRKHVTNSRLNSDEFSVSDNEIILYIDQSASFRLVGQVYQGAKIDGALCVPEAYLITYALSVLVEDPVSGYWYATLPQPPIGLPLGYSVNRVYFKGASYGESIDAAMIKAKRVGRRMLMPLQTGIRCWVENNVLWLATSDGSSLLDQQCYVQMPSARTTDMDAVMNMPMDDLEFVFNDVVKMLLQRYGVPQDVIQDNLPAGNKAS